MSVYDYTMRSAAGEDVSLAQYRGKVLLIVNTATGCGFTPQYEGLEKLYEQYRDRGLEILDFPCNQFGNQAPGTDEEIVSFCKLKYDVSFPQFSKIEVNGPGEAPLFAWLKSERGFAGFPEGHPAAELLGSIAAKTDPDWRHSADIKWNFTKFLLDRNGAVAARFEPMAAPEELAAQIEALL